MGCQYLSNCPPPKVIFLVNICQWPVLARPGAGGGGGGGGGRPVLARELEGGGRVGVLIDLCITNFHGFCHTLIKVC